MELRIDDFIALASGVPLAVLGVAVLLLRPHRRDQVFFGLFAILWAVQITVAYAGSALQDATIQARGTLVSYSILPLLGLLLVHFANILRPAAGLRWVTLLCGGLMLANSVVLLVAPHLLGRIEASPSGPVLRVGPLNPFLIALPLFLGFFAAIAILDRQISLAPEGAPRARIRGILVALALFASYASWRYLLVFLRPSVQQSADSPFTQASLAIVFGACAVATLAFALRAWLVVESGRPRDGAVAAAFLVPAGVAGIEAAFLGLGLELYSFGLWRFATVAVVVYTIAKYRLFDMEIRLKRGVKATTIAAAFIAIFFVVSESAAAFFSGSIGPYLGIVAAGLLVFALAPLQRVAERVANTAMPRATGTEDYFTWRKLQVYHAALDGAMQDGEITAKERAILARLRRELGIADRDAAALEEDLVRRSEHPMPA